MRLRKFTHACLLVEAGDARLLIDPGMFSAGVEELDGLSAVLLTHQHPDHVDLDRLAAVLERNADVELVADEGSATLLREQRGLAARVVHAGDRLEVGGVTLEVVGDTHAEIHRDIPRIPNVGYFVQDRLFHPGDALTVPDREVELLALPTAAPWLKAAEAVDYLRAVAPAVAVPIHEAVAARPGMYYDIFRNLAPDRTDVRVIDGGDPVDL